MDVQGSPIRDHARVQSGQVELDAADDRKLPTSGSYTIQSRENASTTLSKSLVRDGPPISAGVPRRSTDSS